MLIQISEISPDIAEEIWCRCLVQAISDLQLPIGNIDSSRNWFISEVYEIGSFLWVCDHLKINPALIRRKYSSLIYEEYLS
jgi:hypothetical protein